MNALEIQQMHAAISERDHEIATLRERVRVLREACSPIRTIIENSDGVWNSPNAEHDAWSNYSSVTEFLAATNHEEADDAT